MLFLGRGEYREGRNLRSIIGVGGASFGIRRNTLVAKKLQEQALTALIAPGNI